MALYGTNGYAIRAYSEHPIEIWPMDDDVSYISLISDSQRDLTTWTPNANTVVSSIAQGLVPVPPPIDTNIDGTPIVVNGLAFSTVPPASDEYIEVTLDNAIDLNDISFDKGTMTLSLFTYTDISGGLIDRYEIGYTINYPIESNYYSNSFSSIPSGGWFQIDVTGPVPQPTATSISLTIRIYLLQPPTSSVDYFFYTSDFTVGQWSTRTNQRSLGCYPEPLPETLQDAFGRTDLLGVTAQAYGVTQTDGYYIVEDAELLATNYGIPMVYGSDNCTSIYPSPTGAPSVVFPGLGFLNRNFTANRLTAEMWVRIGTYQNTPRKFWGPINSNSGLYVGNGAISLVIDDKFVAYPLNEWERPMLISVVLKDFIATLFIDGEVVGVLEYNSEDVQQNSVEDDWVGFYGSEDFINLEIDCYSVYPYAMPSKVIKRRFVWGQGVESPESINTYYEGTTAFVDYSFSEYDANFRYPGLGNWSAGLFNNVDAEEDAITSPNYQLPRLVLNSEISEDQFLNLNKLLQGPEGDQRFFCFQPAPSGEDPFTDPAFMVWDNFNISKEDPKSFYGIAELPSSIPLGLLESYPLVKFTNIVNGDNLQFIVVGVGDPNSVAGSWIFSSPQQGTTREIYAIEIPYDSKFNFGFNIDKLYDSRNQYIDFFGFFNNVNQIRLQVGGDGEYTFPGYFYSINIADQNATDKTVFQSNIVSATPTILPDKSADVTVEVDNINGFVLGQEVDIYSLQGSTGTFVINSIDNINSTFEINVPSYSGPITQFFPLDAFAESPYFFTNGFMNKEVSSYLLDEMSSYSLIPLLNFDIFYFDIGIYGTWQETYPLSYFAQPVKSRQGRTYWDLDILQFNVGRPSSYSITPVSPPGGFFSYQDLQNEYPVPNTYLNIYKDFLTYQNLSSNTKEESGVYDFSTSDLRFFVSFQDVRSDSYITKRSLRDPYSLPSNETVDMTRYPDQINSAVEIKNRSIIFPPNTTTIDNLVMIVYLQANIRGIKTNPLRLRNMSIISKSFDNNSDDRYNTIGTRFGTPLYSYRRTPFFFDTYSRVPYSIYKDSTPYLYLTQYSGIQNLDTQKRGIESGIAMPMNYQEPLDTSFPVTGIQLWVKYNEEEWPDADDPYAMFNIAHPDWKVFFSIGQDGTADRGKISIYSTDRIAVDPLRFFLYQNGIPTTTFYLEKNKWTSIGINFGTPLQFSSTTGYLNLNYGCVFNNISYYQASLADLETNYVTRIWNQVLYGPVGQQYDWGTWDALSWDAVLNVNAGVGLTGVNPQLLYQQYTGTNRIVVDDGRGIDISNSFTKPFPDTTTSSRVYSNLISSVLPVNTA